MFDIFTLTFLTIRKIQVGYRSLLIFCFIVIATTSFFCAGQVPPSGGPPDTTPPEIVSTYPVLNTLNFRDSKLAIEFNEYVDRRSFEESIFISPHLGELTFDWGGASVEVRFSDSLRKNTTYIATIGTDVLDTRSRNRMANAYSLAFSTGDHIDSGAVSGKVFSDNSEGVMIFAYRLDERSADTINPQVVKPDYLTQTGKDGSFDLTNIGLGSYRLWAIRDEYKNLLYDPQVDQYGVLASDVVLNESSPTLSGLQFRLAKEDTTPPFLSSARSIDQNHVLLRFSEIMDTLTTTSVTISIVDTVSGERLKVYDLSYIEAFSTDAQLVTASQDSSRIYRVFVEGVRDLSGNSINPQTNQGIFSGSSIPDTIKPTIKQSSVQDSVKDVYISDSIGIAFSEPILRQAFADGFIILDSAGVRVDGKLIWVNSMGVSFLPTVPFRFGMWYNTKIVLDSLRDYNGNRYRDSMSIQYFRTVEERNFGGIRGALLDETPIKEGKVFIVVENAVEKNARMYRRKMDETGEFTFEHLPEGKYLVSVFRDSDGNERYTYGKPFPLQFAERFTISPDTLKVRARWMVEGVSLRLR